MNTGAFGEGFPYTNFHDLNMDWIIKIAKDFLDQYSHIQQTINTGLENLDNKYTELEGLLDQWYETHSNDIAQELVNALADINTALAQSIADFNSSAEAKAQEVIATIPSDYTELETRVDNLEVSDNDFNIMLYALSNGGILLHETMTNSTPIIFNTSGIDNTDGKYFTYIGIKNFSDVNAYFNISFKDSNNNYVYYNSGAEDDLPVLVNAGKSKAVCYSIGERINSIEVKSTNFQPYPSEIVIFQIPFEDTSNNFYYTRRQLMNVGNNSTVGSATTNIITLPIDNKNLNLDTYLEIESYADRGIALSDTYIHWSLYGLDNQLIGNYQTTIHSRDHKTIKLPNSARLSKVVMGGAFDMGCIYVSTYQKPHNRTGEIEIAVNELVSFPTTKTYEITLPTENKNCPSFIKLANTTGYAVWFSCTLYDGSDNVIGYEDNPCLILANDSYWIGLNVGKRIAKVKLASEFTFDAQVTIYSLKNTCRNSITVGSSGCDYTALSTAILMANNSGCIDIIVKAGTYDPIAELGGVSNILGNIGQSYRFRAGLEMGYNNHLIGESGAKVECVYLQSEQDIQQYFSLFNGIGSDYIIEDIICSAYNIRYCVHDDPMPANGYTHKYINCQMYMHNENNPTWDNSQAIGTGLGSDATVIIEGGIYWGKSTNYDNAISFHQPVSGHASDYKNLVIINNVFFNSDERIVLTGGQESTNKSDVFITGCNIADNHVTIDPDYWNLFKM